MWSNISTAFLGVDRRSKKGVSKRGCRFPDRFSRRDLHDYYYGGIAGDDDYEYDYSDYYDTDYD